MELLDYLGVADRANNLPDALSGGQQQRVAVARALANQPSLILADEPTAALDSHRGRQVMELFRKVAHERGAAVIVVTHDHRSLDVFDRTLRDGGWGRAAGPQTSALWVELKRRDLTATGRKATLSSLRRFRFSFQRVRSRVTAEAYADGRATIP